MGYDTRYDLRLSKQIIALKTGLWRIIVACITTSGFRGGGAGGVRPPFEIPKRVFKRDPPKTFAPAALAVAAAPPPFHKSWIRPWSPPLDTSMCWFHGCYHGGYTLYNHTKFEWDTSMCWFYGYIPNIKIQNSHQSYYSFWCSLIPPNVTSEPAHIKAPIRRPAWTPPCQDYPNLWVWIAGV